MTQEELLLSIYDRLSGLATDATAYGTAGGDSQLSSSLFALVQNVASQVEAQMGRQVLGSYRTEISAAIQAKK